MKSYLTHTLVMMSMTCFTALAHAELKISDAWVKPTVPGQPVAAAYMNITADKDTEIVEVASPVADKAEIHTMSMDGNIMRMKKLQSLQLKAGKPVALKPGGFHLMLIALHHQIKEGEVVPVSLIYQDESGKRTTVSIKVLAASPKTVESSSDMHMHH